MSNVSIAGDGLRFVFRCLSSYWDTAPYLWFFLAGMILTMFIRKKAVPGIFLRITLVLGLTIYNPLIVRLMVPRIIDEAVYYRLFWLLPVAGGLACYMTWLLSVCSRFRTKAAVSVLFLVIFYLTLPGGRLVDLHLQVPENIWKVPQGVVDACAIIHEDYEGDALPGVVFAEESLYVRQYDAGIRLVNDRDSLLCYFGSTTVKDVTETKSYKYKKRIMDVIFQAEELPKRKQFKRALKKTKTDYLVIPEDYGCRRYLRKCGCKKIGKTSQGWVVYRFFREE